MEKKFIKLNDSFSHLSLGNIINTIREESKNKTSSIQSEVFCVLFNIDYINESTVNNYCIGSRSIGNDYKQIYITLKKKYHENSSAFINIICNVITIIEGSIFDINKIGKINQNKSLINITNKLYNIAKNDFYVKNDFILKLKNYIISENYYDAFVNMLIYAVLDSTQPLYESDKIKNVINTILDNTEISAKELQDFLLLELNEGTNFSYSLNNLALNGNSFAYYKKAQEYYRGEIDGEEDFINSYKYLKLAAINNHPSAYWMIGNMIYKNKLGYPDKQLKEEAVESIEKSASLGNIAAINTLGLFYENGFGVNKNVNKAFSCYEEAAKKNYAYALNNLARLNHKIDKEKEINYYLESAKLGESYACNKVGLYYLEKKEYLNAYNYFNKALSCNIRAKCFWAYYNLAKYYYSSGNIYINIPKDRDKAIKYYKISSSLIESLIELLFIYIDSYLNNMLESKEIIFKIIKEIENHHDYNETYKNIIENNINKIKKNKIDINLI